MGVVFRFSNDAKARTDAVQRGGHGARAVHQLVVGRMPASIHVVSGSTATKTIQPTTKIKDHAEVENHFFADVRVLQRLPPIRTGRTTVG